MPMNSGSHDPTAAPISSSFAPSSWSSTLGVTEVLASYRRSQYIITGQNVASSVGTDESVGNVDEEAQYSDEDALRFSEDEELPTPRQQDRDEAPILSNLEWDEDLETPATQSSEQLAPPRRQWGIGRPTVIGRSPTQAWSGPTGPTSSEQTPLLRKAPSKSAVSLQLPHSRQNAALELDGQAQSSSSIRHFSLSSHDPKARLKRKVSAASTRSEKQLVSGKSTFGQTLFNSIAILLGFGMLSEPLAFAYAGWIGGTILIIFYGLITCYTAKILAHIMVDDPQIRTYADIGNKAFGQHSRFITSFLFCMELFAVSVVLVTLYGDSLHSILPTYSTETYKIIGLVILIPSVFCPLSVLSYTSILGILSTLLIISVLFIDGLSKSNAPGSLWSPAETSMGIAGFGELGIAFGLFMAGFSGHAVLPSLARDMADPAQFDKMIDWAFIAATVIYAFIGGCGYLMFGNSVSDEVSRDLLDTPGYNEFLNKLAVWSLVVMPLTKFALATRPVNITLEIIFGLEANSFPQLHAHEDPVGTLTTSQTKRPRLVKDILIFVERTVFACLSVAVSILVPEFSSMMAFLGSFSAFMLCVIGPVSAKIVLAGKCGWGDAALLAVATIMAVWGTIAAFAA
ncbi:transmembrane amino acid transporter protein-domain-containing protein [Phellopilus nigrolimitatus]|nr:transmembrane amino acid transporter protein-domain-containing protein [Phellopilus nigrolimitatus]